MTEEITIDDTGTGSDSADPKWFIDEGVPGVGERPEWLSSKFKTAADLAKSYGELEKRVGVVPEDYDLSKSRYIDSDFDSFVELKELAKAKRVPQEVMDKMLQSFDTYMDTFAVDPKKEAEKLGENSKERLDKLNNWAKANLSESSSEALFTSLRTADSIKALEELRSKFMNDNTHIPNGNENASSNSVSLADVQNELSQNLEKYKTDTSYRKEIQQKMALAAKNSDFVDKRV